MPAKRKATKRRTTKKTAARKPAKRKAAKRRTTKKTAARKPAKRKAAKRRTTKKTAARKPAASGMPSASGGAPKASFWDRLSGKA